MSARASAALLRARDTLATGVSSERREALERLVSLGLPTPRDDAFRYANLRSLERRDLLPAAFAPLALPEELPLGEYRLVLCNGQIDPSRSHLPDGVTMTRQAGLVPGADTSSEGRLRLLNGALACERTDITVTRGVNARLDLVIVGGSGGAYPQIAVRVEQGAHLTLTEHLCSDEAAESVSSIVIDADIAHAATLDHTLLQIAGARSIVLCDVRAELAADARYHHRLAALGGQLFRLDLSVGLNGPGAEASLAGLFMADGTREQHLRTVVRHRAPNGSSQQTYRGVANGRGRGSFDGKVVVDAHANGTNSVQSSRNLLLGTEASIETRPQLEINAHAVKCSHGATTGSLDEKMMFYLLSRGLDRDTARAVLTYAFLGDVLTGFDEASRAFVERCALTRLPSADVVREFVA